MLNTKQFSLNYPDIYEELDNFFNSNNFPCLFARASFNKKIMQFSIAENIEHFKLIIPQKLTKILLGFNSLTTDTEKSFYTGIFIIKKRPEKLEEIDFILDILRHLIEEDSYAWPLEKTKNTNTQEFNFFWNSEEIFPVLTHPEHKEIIRRSPYLIIAFQPGKVFDFNKVDRKDFFEKIRASIHKKIDKIYLKKRPFYLSNKSSGKNICQYAGKDMTEYIKNYSYPTL